MEPTRHRAVAGVGDLRPGDHLCWAYHDGRAFLDGLVRFITDGIRSRQRVACSVPSPGLDAVRRAIAARTPGFDDAERRGAVLLGTAEDAYLAEGSFDPEQRLAGYAEMAERAVADGFTALRVIAEASGVAGHPATLGHWLAYELRADLLIARLPLIAVCAYDGRLGDGTALSLLRSVHGSCLGPWEDDPSFQLRADGRGSLALDGEIDLVNADVVAELAAAAARDVTEPVLDLSGLRFVDVSGMRAVVLALRALADDAGGVTIRGAGATFRQVWSLMACDRQIEAEFEPA